MSKYLFLLKVTESGHAMSVSTNPPLKLTYRNHIIYFFKLDNFLGIVEFRAFNNLTSSELWRTTPCKGYIFGDKRVNLMSEVRILNGVPVDQCLNLVKNVQENPSKGQTVWKASTSWKGGFECESTIRNHTVLMNEPKGLGGSDSAPNMVEMVLAAYSSCLTVGYNLNASIQGINVRNIKVEVQGDLDLQGFFGLSESVPAGFSSINATVYLDSDATESQLAALHEKVLKTSPVGSILSRSIPVNTQLVTNKS